jgi:hypothetical protein
LAVVEIICAADAGEDLVNNTNLGVFGGDKGASLREDADQYILAQESGFTSHIGAVGTRQLTKMG